MDKAETTISLPVQTVREVEEIARRLGITAEELMRRAVSFFLASEVANHHPAQ